MAKRKTKLKNELKKAHKKHFWLALLFLVLGIGAGFGTTYFLTRIDVFEIIGETEITLNVGDEYVEAGAKAIAFGKDISSNVKIEGEVDTTQEGRYIIKYTVNHLRFKGHTLYKLVIVGGEE